MGNTSELEIIIPISLELDWPTKGDAIASIRELNQKYGLKRFALAFPCGGWRSSPNPPQEEYFREKAQVFREIKDELAPEGIICGWWITLTIKSSPKKEWTRIMRGNGEEMPFANCPLDPGYRRWFTSNTALTAAIAKPAFIMTEDDYALHGGCFCDRHMAEFSRREGRIWERAELAKALSEDSEESKRLHNRWCALKRDTLSDFAADIRSAVDLQSPEIPIGTCQSGSWDMDGDATESVSRAFAGGRHRPFSRLYGTFYGGEDILAIPEELHHPLHYRQTLPEDFICLHESDTFPHTRFFTSAASMRVMMSAVYSQGYDGSVFQAQQLLDAPNEETAYGQLIKQEHHRFQAMHDAAKQCRLGGVQIPFVPIDAPSSSWTRCVSHFGIPYTTLNAQITMLDGFQASAMDDSQIMELFKKGLFIDGEAAKILFNRGFSEFIGVDVGADAVSGLEQYDLGGREVIQDGFALDSIGRNMHRPGFFAPHGNGASFNLFPRKGCEILTRLVSFQKRELGVGMTRFVNRLGGRIVVMGMGTAHNHSSSLFNYRRQKLIQEQIVWCGDDVAFVKDAPRVFIIMNCADAPSSAGFNGMLTLTNLNPDRLDDILIHLPKQWRDITRIRLLDKDGEWRELPFAFDGDCIRLSLALEYAKPQCILL